MASSKPMIIAEKTFHLQNFRKIRHIIEEQGWEEYLSSLEGPIYPQLVKEFWKNASIKRKKSHSFIKSKVIGVPVTITPKCIAKVIKCSEEGIDIEKYLYCNDLRPKVLRKLYDFSGGRTETKDLKPIVQQLFQIQVCNFMPKEGKHPTLTIDRVFLFFLLRKYKINLPLTIFNHMKSCIELSKQGNIDFIPYGRVITMLITHLEVVKKTRYRHLTEYLAPSWTSPLKLDEERMDMSWSRKTPSP